MADATHEPLDAALRRLKKERDDADQRYNEALTNLDRTFRPPVGLPEPPPGLDDHQIAQLNEAWNILPSEPAMGGLKGRLAGFVWRLVAPYFQRQLTFNSKLVDHVNRNAAAARAAHDASGATAAALRQQLASLHEFQARLLVYLQQITAYIDTRDRDTAGGALALNAAISGLAEADARRWESLTARDQRMDGRMAALSSAHDELRALTGVSQHALLSLKREVERLVTSGHAPAPAPPGIQDSTRAVPARDAFAPALDAYKYVGFEDQFRGSRDVIRQRLESYIPFFTTDDHRQDQAPTDARSQTIDGTDLHRQGSASGEVLDVGCGRGEFLDLLAAHGIPARGIDLNHEMAESCRARGLNVLEADAVGYLASLPDASLGGIFAAQVVEHLEPAYLLQFLELAFHKLRPGGRLVLETLNPACWVAFFESYIRDITHVWPLHPETLKYLVIASGFTRADIEFRSPVPEQDRLQPIAVPAGADATLADLAEAFNGNVEKLNSRMFTFMDYAIVGQKAGSPALA
jgi:SAM-dependent methyltransferase